MLNVDRTRAPELRRLRLYKRLAQTASALHTVQRARLTLTQASTSSYYAKVVHRSSAATSAQTLNCSIAGLPVYKPEAMMPMAENMAIRPLLSSRARISGE